MTRMRSPRASATARPSRAGTVMVVAVLTAAAEMSRTRNSPSWLAFRPPTERAFELPLQLLRLASTYSAALDGAGVKVRHRATACNPKVHAVCDVPPGRCGWVRPAPRGTGHPLIPPEVRSPRTKEIRRRGWPFVPRPKERSSHLYSSSVRLRPTRLPATAQWSSYGTPRRSATRKFTHFATLRHTTSHHLELPPMRVFIVSDMEGVAGITNWSGVGAGDPLYEEGRTLYTEEINAAVRGARAAGATEFVVQREWTEYTGALEDGCDAALFVGMHAMAGTADAQMSHTVSGTQWHGLSVNGRETGETGINAALCGTWGCPVLLVTGDQSACREGKELLGDGLETVQVKTALGRFSARHKTPNVARSMIEEGARRALGNLTAVALYDPGRPCEIRVEFASSDHAEQFRHHPAVVIADPRTIVSTGPDWWSAWRQFYFSFRWPD